LLVKRDFWTKKKVLVVKFSGKGTSGSDREQQVLSSPRLGGRAWR
jgi:hypothetical protein